MNLDARIAYINSQVACMLAELEAMKAANRQRREQGLSDAYGEEAFSNLPVQFGISHNQVIDYLRGC